jgi:hypothetical protein
MKRLFCCLLLMSAGLCSSAQKNIPILERKISITAQEEKVQAVLSRVAQAAEFSFSYNSQIISANQVVTLDVHEKTVRDVLNEIFKGSMNYKEKANYLILTKAQPAVIRNKPGIVVNGYIENASTGEKIAHASVYEKSSLASAVSDDFGYFNLKLEKKTDTLFLEVRKKNFRDTTVNITLAANQYITLFLKPVPDSVIIQPVARDTVAAKREEFSFPYETEPNVQNIHDTLHRLVQVSILPFIGTHEMLSGNVINDYSINFFAGYSMGTRQIELGFFLNMDRADVSWLQIAGFGNLVGRNMYGIQAAGFFNINGGETNAVQLAGFANTNFDHSRGVQVSGFANTNLQSMNGVQVAGFSNVTLQSSYGVQVAGVGNMIRGSYRGSQVAGIVNITTEKISGSQIAGVFNFAKRVQGTQIGLINYADSLGGIPVGLFSLVKYGYHKVELSADEIFSANLAYRTGVRKFYTILQAGFKPDQSLHANDTSVWSFGYGLGTARKLTRWLYLNVDFTSQHINKGSFTNSLSLLNRMHLGLDFQLTKKLSVYGGLTWNGYLTRTLVADYPQLFTDYSPRVFFDQDIRSNNLKMWWGAKFGVRFF